MRKTVIILMAVAILGILGLRASHKSAASNAQANLPASSASVSSSSQPTSATSMSGNTSSGYKDGTYTGSTTSTAYGNVKVAAVISGGKIIDIQYLQMPDSEGESIRHTHDSEPLLTQSAIVKQSARVDFVTGATDTSFGFAQSLQAALDQASMS